MLVNLFDGLNFIHVYEAFCGLHPTPAILQDGQSCQLGWICSCLEGTSLGGLWGHFWEGTTERRSSLEVGGLFPPGSDIRTSEEKQLGIPVFATSLWVLHWDIRIKPCWGKCGLKTSYWIKRNLPGLQHILELLRNTARWAEQLLDSQSLQ